MQFSPAPIQQPALNKNIFAQSWVLWFRSVLTKFNNVDKEVDDINEILKLTLSTGLVKGGEITVNAIDNTKFDVASGFGYIVNSADPANITFKKIEWDDIVGISADFIATAPTTFIAIDENKGVFQQVDFPERAVLRDYIQIGSIVHGNNVSISGTSDFTSAPITQVAPSLTDLIIALNVINVEGNEVSGDPAGNLKFKKDSGVMFYFGIDHKADYQDPNKIDTPELIAPQIIFTWMDGSGGWNTSTSDAITAGVFDDGTGGVGSPAGSLTNNQWTNCRVQYSPDANQLVITYGQNKYNSDTTAVVAIESESFETNPSFSGVPFVSVCTIRGGAVDLTLAGDGVFTQADRFGGF